MVHERRGLHGTMFPTQLLSFRDDLRGTFTYQEKGPCQTGPASKVILAIPILLFYFLHCIPCPKLKQRQPGAKTTITMSKPTALDIVHVAHSNKILSEDMTA